MATKQLWSGTENCNYIPDKNSIVQQQRRLRLGEGQVMTFEFKNKVFPDQIDIYIILDDSIPAVRHHFVIFLMVEIDIVKKKSKMKMYSYKTVFKSG